MIQIVCVKWGTRYTAGEVNFMYEEAKRRSSEDIRFVCVTDDTEGDFDPAIQVKPFPPMPQPMAYMTDGCLAKLVMFAKGVLEPGIATIFFDLDTMIRGDLARLAKLVRERRGIHMMPNHFLQIWKFQNHIRPLLRGRYYFGNSSLLGFFPEDMHFIYDRMMEVFSQPLRPRPKKYATDERFISSQATELVAVFPKSLAVKFADEYILTRWPIVEAIRKRLPWIANRRKNMVAVTFVSDDLKPQKVARLQPGDVVKYKGRPHFWDNQEYTDYWRKAIEHGKAADG